MQNIDEILFDFLKEQKQRLKQKTFREYESVIDFFKIYLNSYGYLQLNDEENDRWTENYEEDEDCFTKIFGSDQLYVWVFRSYLKDFIMRKVVSEDGFLKVAIRVMKKLSEWLFEHNYIDQESKQEMEEFFSEEARLLPDMQKLSGLLYEYADWSPQREYEEILEGDFIVTDVKKGELWIEEFFDDNIIGPVVVPYDISSLCQKDWRINLMVGRVKDKWYCIESGNVF